MDKIALTQAELYDLAENSPEEILAITNSDSATLATKAFAVEALGQVHLDPNISSSDIKAKLNDVNKAIQKLKTKLNDSELDIVRRAASHVIKMLLKDGRLPSEVRTTADDGVVFYFYPIPSAPEIYACIEVFEDGGIITAWSNGDQDDAWDNILGRSSTGRALVCNQEDEGSSPSAPTTTTHNPSISDSISQALKELSAFSSSVEIKETIIKLLMHKDSCIRESAIYALDDVPNLEELTILRDMKKNDPSPGVRKVATEILKEICAELHQWHTPY